MQKETPILKTGHRSSMAQIISLPLAALVVFFGIMTGGIPLIVLGLLILVITWVMTPTHYELYRDRVVVNYGGVRKSVIPLEDVEDLGIVRLPTGERLYLKRKSRRGTMINPKDREEFIKAVRDIIGYARPEEPEGEEERQA